MYHTKLWLSKHKIISELRCCVKVGVAILGSQSLIVFMVSVDVKQDWTDAEFRSCVKVGVAILGTQSLKVLMVSVDVKQHWTSMWNVDRVWAEWKSRWPSLIVLTVSVDADNTELKRERTKPKQNGTQLGLRSTVHQFNCSHVAFFLSFLFLLLQGIQTRAGMWCIWSDNDIKPLIQPWFRSQILGAGIARWLERQTCDWEVVGLSPCRSDRRIFFSTVNFLCWLLCQYPFHPCVTAVACAKS